MLPRSANCSFSPGFRSTVTRTYPCGEIQSPVTGFHAFCAYQMAEEFRSGFSTGSQPEILWSLLDCKTSESHRDQNTSVYELCTTFTFHVTDQATIPSAVRAPRVAGVRRVKVYSSSRRWTGGPAERGLAAASKGSSGRTETGNVKRDACAVHHPEGRDWEPPVIFPQAQKERFSCP